MTELDPNLKAVIEANSTALKALLNLKALIETNSAELEALLVKIGSSELILLEEISRLTATDAGTLDVPAPAPPTEESLSAS